MHTRILMKNSLSNQLSDRAYMFFLPSWGVHRILPYWHPHRSMSVIWLFIATCPNVPTKSIASEFFIATSLRQLFDKVLSKASKQSDAEVSYSYSAQWDIKERMCQNWCISGTSNVEELTKYSSVSEHYSLLFLLIEFCLTQLQNNKGSQIHQGKPARLRENVIRDGSLRSRRIGARNFCSIAMSLLPVLCWST